MDLEMRIAPKLDGDKFKGEHWIVQDWITLKEQKHMDWEKATQILHDRIHGRFLRVCDNVKKLEGAGFAIVSLNCLLIETLQQFWDGEEETRTKSDVAFKNFFKNFKFFDNGFEYEKVAVMFYKQIRCGLLHQAQIKGQSKIIRDQEEMIQLPNRNQPGLIIDRDKFHEKLKDVFDWYIEGLKGINHEWPPEMLEDRRCNFRRKMNFICNSTDSVE